MARFRFRAQAALDLRRREDDEAKGAFAQAERDLLAAVTAVSEADGRIASARATQTEALSTPGEAGTQQWYRFWIVRLEQERDACAAHVAVCEVKRDEMKEVCRQTRQRVESLERFRDKAQHAHQRAEDAEAQKTIDAVGTLRFVARKRAG